MNCEECKEQVFELIERDAVDPEGVRAILAACPDCRAEFDAMKAALALVDQLPVDEPPPEIDAAILGLAERRIEATSPDPGETDRGQLIPMRKRLLQTPPWAMAAIALLAVGVGVWSIPQTVELESGAIAPELEAEAASQKQEFSPDQGLARGLALEETAVAAIDDDLEGAPALGTERAKSSPRSEPRLATRAKKRQDGFGKQSAPEADEESYRMVRKEAPAEAEDDAPAPAARRTAAPEAVATGAVASDAAAGSAGQEAKAAAVAEKPVATGAKGDARARSRSLCETELAAFETRLSEDPRYAPNPEEQLAMGRCYQTVGNTDRARQWLERAAEHSETKRRAKQALRALSSK